MLLAASLPTPQRAAPPQINTPSAHKAQRSVPYPPYGQRQNYRPRSEEDFGDGGAFPEIQMSQFPLGMGRKNTTSTAIVPVTLDSEGKIKHEAVLGHRSDRRVVANPQDLVPSSKEEAKPHPDEEEIARVTAETRAALEQKISKKIAASQPSRPNSQSKDPDYIRYTPANQQGHFNSGATSRLIRLVDAPVDPLEPPKFKHKKAPRGPPSPPPPVMHSPPRKLSQKDVADWKIPPCISNWKNPKGYTIPLDKRLAADGRGLQQIQINDNFAKLSESLVIAERNAREAVSHRNKIKETLARNKIQQKEELLRKIAEQTREERTQTLAMVKQESSPPPKAKARSRSRSPSLSLSPSSPNRSLSPSPVRSHKEKKDSEEAIDDRSISAKEKRDMIRKERERERERDRRMEAMGRKTKAMRDAERDISEKVALGQKAPATRKETQYDSRLFNQAEGMDSGFGAEDDYNLYDKPLLRGSNANTLYRPRVGDSDVYGNASEMDKLLDTKKFKPSRDFDGIDRSEEHRRSGPVQFEKMTTATADVDNEDDPFGLDEFISEAKTKALDHIGQRGQLHAGAAGGGATDGPGKRSRMEFEKESEESESARKRTKSHEEKGRDHDRDRDRDRDRERERERERDRDRDRDRDRGRRESFDDDRSSRHKRSYEGTDYSDKRRRRD